MEVDQRKTAVIMNHLELVKQTKAKTLHMLQLKERLQDEIEVSQKEDRCLQDYHSEMEMLVQEKMAHVDELRQIHADINAMETITKQSEQARVKALDNVQRLEAEYGNVKAEVDGLRKELNRLSLGRFPELQEEESKPIIHEYVPPPAVVLYPQTSAAMQAAAVNSFIMSQNQLALRQFAPKPERPSPQHNILSSHPTGPTPTFRQQAPPMKSCMSCHQQIHRNAPICPMCKAKSRSQNPKKSKKKEKSLPN